MYGCGESIYGDVDNNNSAVSKIPIRNNLLLLMYILDLKFQTRVRNNNPGCFTSFAQLLFECIF